MLEAQEIGQLKQQLAAAQAEIEGLRTHVEQLGEIGLNQQARIAELRGALEELIACKNLADKFDELKENVHDFATAAVIDGIRAEYHRRKPAAWQAARRAVTLPDSLPALESIKQQTRREALMGAADLCDDLTCMRPAWPKEVKS